MLLLPSRRLKSVRDVRPALVFALTLAALPARAQTAPVSPGTTIPTGTLAIGTRITVASPSGNVTLQKTASGVTVMAAQNSKVTTLADGQITIELQSGEKIVVFPNGNIVVNARAAPSNAPASAVTSMTGDAAAAIEALYLRGNYDQALAQGEDAPVAARADPRLLYFRGDSAYAIGNYTAARRDFSVLGAFKPYGSWETAQFRLERIDKMEAVMPPHQVEMRDKNGAVIFRVHYDEENRWSRGIMALLPQAYRLNCDLLGQEMKETPIFIFKDASRYEKFLSAHHDADMTSWEWATGGLGTLCFCQEYKTAPHDAQGDYLRGTVVHEFNHNLVRRITGDAALPTWFEEGLAMSVEPLLLPRLAQRFAKDFQAAAKANALLPIQTMTGRSEFDAAVEKSIQSDKCDPYAQGWSMTTYLLLLLSPPKLTPFLEEVRDSRDFDKTLLKFTGLTPDAFYAKWRAQLPKVAAQNGAR